MKNHALKNPRSMGFFGNHLDISTMPCHRIARLCCLLAVALWLGLVFTVPAYSATNVGGTVSSDTTWDLAGSPYIVISDVTVGNAVTLTIDAGVEVKFEAGRAMTILGTLSAVGTSGQEIIFTSANAMPAPGDWAGVYFQGDGTNYRVGNPEPLRLSLWRGTKQRLHLHHPSYSRHQCFGDHERHRGRIQR